MQLLPAPELHAKLTCLHSVGDMCTYLQPLRLLQLPVFHSRVAPEVVGACSGMRDLLDLLQSQTFVAHLGYGLLEILLAHMFPELEPLLRQTCHGT